MQRQPEPELMDDPAQAHAYAHADFTEPHNHFVELFRRTFPDLDVRGRVLDLGCGSADVTLRFARAYPHCVIDAVDGADAMLRHAQKLLTNAQMQSRVTLMLQRLPVTRLTEHSHDVIISNSLLHHLHQPLVLWDTVKAHAHAGTAIFVMDLLRPASPQAAADLVERYAGGEPEILKRDFYNSLLAAFRAGEVAAQLAQSGLDSLEVRAVSDRHLVVSGIIP